MSSSLTRRQFLKRFGGGAAAVALAIPAAYELEKLLWTGDGAAATTALLPELDPTALIYLAKRIVVRLSEQLTAVQWPLLPLAEGVNLRIGDRAESLMLSHQFSVDFPPLDEIASATEAERWTELAATNFSRRIQQRGVQVFACLELPQCIEEAVDVRHGAIALRALRAYSVHEDRVLVRFDLLGGRGPLGIRLAERGRQHELATSIKRRLGRPRIVPRLPA